LNVFAAIDFAYSVRLKSDYTAIVVVGVDSGNQYYILDIERFKSTLISDYFNRILVLHQKWDFRKLRAEVTAAQQVIVKDLKESYIRVHGLALSIDEHKPNRHEGTKEERLEATLQPKYANLQMWHYHGGNCQILEEELVLQNPPHDDVKDALASALEICVAPTAGASMGNRPLWEQPGVINSRFGGVAF
jgi:phage terminase large subunit-like protein